jgi:hypothetical protein
VDDTFLYPVVLLLLHHSDLDSFVLFFLGLPHLPVAFGLSSCIPMVLCFPLTTVEADFLGPPDRACFLGCSSFEGDKKSRCLRFHLLSTTSGALGTSTCGIGSSLSTSSSSTSCDSIAVVTSSGGACGLNGNSAVAIFGPNTETSLVIVSFCARISSRICCSCPDSAFKCETIRWLHAAYLVSSLAAFALVTLRSNSCPGFQFQELQWTGLHVLGHHFAFPFSLVMFNFQEEDKDVVGLCGLVQRLRLSKFGK